MNALHLNQLANMLAQPLALMPEAHPVLRANLLAARGGAVPRSASRRKGRREIIRVFGVLEGQHPGLFSMLGMGVSTGAIAQQLQLAVMDDDVSEIVLHFHSSGGSVEGIQELNALIERSAASKPVTAFVQGCCGSAAYWLASAADRVVATPSSQIGGIGVWMAHENISKALDNAGVTMTLVSAGKYKTEGNPYGPLGADARAHMQYIADSIYSSFAKAVAKGRSVPVDKVRKGMGQGRMLLAPDAKKEGMIDHIAADLDGAPMHPSFARKVIDQSARGLQ